MNPSPDLAVPITVRIARLPSLPFDEIKSLWQRLYGKPAPTHNRPYLERRLAYRLQELEYAGVHPDLLARNKERIDALVQQQSRKKRIRGELVQLVPGTVLTRDFLGVEYRVTTLPDGQYEYNGKPYRSLTAIANEISGTRWSGPAFFGLREKSKGKKK